MTGRPAEQEPASRAPGEATAVSPHGVPDVETVNMTDVARVAEVSIATVSRALRGLPGVSPSTRARVVQVATDLAYVVSPNASGLAQGATRTIAVVLPRLDAWFQATMLGAIEATVRDSGVDVLVYQVDGETQRRRFLRDLPSRRKVDVVVLVALPLRAEEEERLDLLGVDVVVAGGRLRDYPHVEVDDHALAVAAVAHLAGLGHHRIGLIRTLDTDGAVWSSDVRRLEGYVAGLEAVGLAALPELVVSRPFGTTAGADGMAELLSLPEPPTAVLCYSDEIAVAALSTLHRRGLQVPRDVSLMGIDGHPLAELFGITSIAQSVAYQGRVAAAMALRLMTGEPLDETHVEVTWTLHDRGSTGRAGELGPQVPALDGDAAPQGEPGDAHPR